MNRIITNLIFYEFQSEKSIIYIYVYVCVGYSINTMNIAKGIGSRKHCLQMHPFVENKKNDRSFHTHQRLSTWPSLLIAQSARTVEFIDCTSAVRPFNECPGYNTKQSDGEAPVMLGLWIMRRNPTLPLLPGPLRPWVVAPDRALSMG